MNKIFKKYIYPHILPIFILSKIILKKISKPTSLLLISVLLIFGYYFDSSAEIHLGLPSAVKNKVQQLKEEKLKKSAVIISLTTDSTSISTGAVTTITCIASDLENDPLTYTWSAESGTILGTDSQITWTAPSVSGTYTIYCTVSDEKGNSTQQSVNVTVTNDPPTITSLTANPTSISTGVVTTITCIASDPDNDPLTYTWSAASGTVSGIDSQITWTAPSVSGTYTIYCTVSDGKGNSTQQSVSVTVTNDPPTITSLTANPTSILTGAVTTITCIASDPDNDILTYTWSAESGTISGTDSQITWTAPSVSGTYTIYCTVSDEKGNSTQQSVNVTVTSVLWTKQLGTSANDIGWGVATDSSGNIYVTGWTEGSLDGNTNQGNDDIFLIKYDTNGTKIWTKQPGTSGYDAGFGVATDLSDNIYVTGWTSGGFDGSTNQGGYDIFLTKYNTNGTKLWTRQHGTIAADVGSGVATDSSGNIYIIGWTSGNLDGNTSQGGYDIFLTKYDTNGNKLWTKQLGTSDSDVGSGVATDSSGNIYITGRTSGGLDGNTNQGDVDIFLTKYDTNGNKLWTKQFGTSEYDRGAGVVTDLSGNIYITGRTSGGLDGNTNQGGVDIFLTKYDTNGTKLWTKQIGTSDTDLGHGVATDLSSNIYVTGNSMGNLDGNTNQGGYDIFLTKYDTNGNKLWTKQLGTSDSDVGSGVATDSSGNIYVTGDTMGNLDGNTNQGGNDIFLVKYAP